MEAVITMVLYQTTRKPSNQIPTKFLHPRLRQSILAIHEIQTVSGNGDLISLGNDGAVGWNNLTATEQSQTCAMHYWSCGRSGSSFSSIVGVSRRFIASNKSCFSFLEGLRTGGNSQVFDVSDRSGGSSGISGGNPSQ